MIFSNINLNKYVGYSADGTRGVVKDIIDKNLIEKKNNLLKKVFDDLKDIKSDLNKIIYRDLVYTKLQRILKSCDRSSMSNSKELRVPLLDHRLVEFFLTYPQIIKFMMVTSDIFIEKFMKKILIQIEHLKLKNI